MNRIYSLPNLVSIGGRKSFWCTENVTFEQNLEEQVAGVCQKSGGEDMPGVPFPPPKWPGADALRIH